MIVTEIKGQYVQLDKAATSCLAVGSTPTIITVPPETRFVHFFSDQDLAITVGPDSVTVPAPNLGSFCVKSGVPTDIPVPAEQKTTVKVNGRTATASVAIVFLR